MREPVNEHYDLALGDTVRDMVTGFTGMAVACTTWLHGCIRIVIEPPMGKDGKLLETEGFDIQRLEVVTKGNGPPTAKPNYDHLTPLQKLKLANEAHAKANPLRPTKPRARTAEPPGGPQRGSGKAERR